MSGKVVSMRKKPKDNAIVLTKKFLNNIGVVSKRNMLTHQVEVEHLHLKYLIEEEGEMERLICHLSEQTEDADAPLPRKEDLETVLKGTAKKYDPCKKIYDSLAADNNIKTSALEILFKSNTTDIAMYKAFLQQIVRRMKEPGCHAPHMLVLQGKQGFGKTMLIEELSCGFFTKDSFQSDANSILRKLSGNLIAEVPEMNWSRNCVDKVKDIISSTEDHWHDKYKRLCKAPRRCLFIGSTNRPTPFGNDDEGRRFWLINCIPLRIAAERFKLEDGQKRFNALNELRRQVRKHVLNDLAIAKQEVIDGAGGFLSLSQTNTAADRFAQATYADDLLANLLAEHGNNILKSVSRKTTRGYTYLIIKDLVEELIKRYPSTENESFVDRLRERLNKTPTEISSFLLSQNFKKGTVRIQKDGKTTNPIRVWKLDT